MRTDRILPAIGISILAAVPGTVLLFVLLKVAWWLPLLALVVGLAGLVAFLTTAGSSVHRIASAIALWLPLLALAIFIAVKMLGFAQSQGFLPSAVSAPAATVQPSGEGAQATPPAVQETETSVPASSTPTLMTTALSCVVPTLDGQFGGYFLPDVRGMTVNGPAIIHNNEGDGPDMAKANGLDYVPRVGVIVPEGKSITWGNTVASASAGLSTHLQEWISHWLTDCP